MPWKEEHWAGSRQVMTSSDLNNIVFDFSDADRVGEWRAINDGVMGGLSSSAPQVIGGALHFAGRISLENNGGFASIRAPLQMNFTGAAGLLLRVRGDGRSYQLRLYTDAVHQHKSIAYSFTFNTIENHWLELPVEFRQLSPVFRGRVLSGPEFSPAAVEQIGFLLADRQPGSFLLCIDWIKTIPLTRTAVVAPVK